MRSDSPSVRRNLGTNRRRRLERRGASRAYPAESAYGFSDLTFSQYQSEMKNERAHEQQMAKQQNIAGGIMAGGQLIGDLTAMTGQLIGMKVQAKGQANLARVQGKWGSKLASKQAKLTDSQTGLTHAQAGLASAMRPTPWALIAAVVGVTAIGLGYVLTRDKK